MVVGTVYSLLMVVRIALRFPGPRAATRVESRCTGDIGRSIA